MDLFGTQRRKRRRELWQAVAGELGGQHHPAEGFWNPKHERIEATVRGIAIVLETYAVSNGKTTQVYTRVRGNYAHGPGPKLRVYKYGALQALGKMLGLEDHRLGDAAFDDTFVVKSDSAAVARRLWSDDARRVMLARFRDAKLTSTRTGLELLASGVWEDRETLQDGVFLIAELASRDLYGALRLPRVADAVLSTDRDGWPRIELDTGVRVVIRAETIDDRLVMVARSSERPTIAECAITIVDGKLVHHAEEARLPQAAHVPLRAVGSGVLTAVADGASFAWQDLDIDPAALRAGAALVAALSGALDAYR